MISDVPTTAPLSRNILSCLSELPLPGVSLTLPSSREPSSESCEELKKLCLQQRAGVVNTVLRTLLVKRTKRMPLTNPCAESPIPCKRCSNSV